MRIRFCSPVQSHMGYAELGRTLVNQLVLAGHAVTVVPIPMEHCDLDFGPLGAQAIRLIGEDTRADVNIVNMIAPLFPHFRLPGARNIGYTMFEADALPPGWAAACNAMDAVWVPSAWMRGVFVAAGVTVPVFAVPPDAVDLPVAVPAPGPFRLLSVFQWSARKNPADLIRAFCAAFDGAGDVVLTLKAYRTADEQHNTAYIGAAIKAILAQCRPRTAFPRIELLASLYTAAQMRALFARSHAYVSLAHAEGWGLPAWEATLSGLPVIHTDWSTPAEFVHPQGLVRSHPTPVSGMEDFVPYYDLGMNWAQPQLDDAMARLRDLRVHRDAWRDTALAHRDDIRRRYSLAHCLGKLPAALGMD